MSSLLVHLTQDVEQEWLHIKIKCFVVQEQLGQKTQVLAVDLVVCSIHLVDAEGPLAVNVAARGLSPRALTLVGKKETWLSTEQNGTLSSFTAMRHILQGGDVIKLSILGGLVKYDCINDLP